MRNVELRDINQFFFQETCHTAVSEDRHRDSSLVSFVLSVRLRKYGTRLFVRLARNARTQLCTHVYSRLAPTRTLAAKVRSEYQVTRRDSQDSRG